MSWTQEKISEVYMEVRNLAVTDEEFREKLLADPAAAIQEIAGVALPDDFKVKIVEEDPQYNATFLLPQMLESDLSAEELDQVAGGSCVADGNCGADNCAAFAHAKIRIKNDEKDYQKGERPSSPKTPSHKPFN